MFLIEWLAMLLVVAQVWAYGHSVSWGAILGITGSVLWAAIGWHSGIESLIVLQVVLVGAHFLNLYKGDRG